MFIQVGSSFKRRKHDFWQVQQEEEQVNLLKYSQSGLIKKSRHWVPLTVSRAATSTSTGKDLECIMSVVDLAGPSLRFQSNRGATLLGSPSWNPKAWDNAKKETSAEFLDIVKWNAQEAQEFTYFMQIFGQDKLVFFIRFFFSLFPRKGISMKPT